MVNRAHTLNTSTGTLQLPDTRLRAPMSGTRLREVRLEIGLNQRELADLVGLSPKHLSRMERGGRNVDGPMVRLLEFLLGAFAPGAPAAN